jgi:hypothetical protein
MSDWRDDTFDRYLKQGDLFVIALIEALAHRTQGRDQEALQYLDVAARLYDAPLAPPSKRKRGRRAITDWHSEPDRSALDYMDHLAKKTGEHHAETLAGFIADWNPNWRPDLADLYRREPQRRVAGERAWATMHVTAASREACVKRLAKKWRARAKIKSV